MAEPKKKSEVLAFVLNGLLAGAGFGYLGLWKYALLNLAAVLATGLCLSLFFPEFMVERSDTVALFLGITSGLWAMETAKDMNKERESEMERRVDEIGRDE